MENHQPQMFGTAYRVTKRIGTGGFAQVYLVEDDRGQQWALKQFRENLIKQDPGFHERFQREARIQIGLKHPHIVGVHDFDAKEGYLVIDYVNGRTLQNFLEEDYPDGMDPDTAVKILAPLEEALTYIHKDAGFTHLDITPKNILIQEIQTRGREIEWDLQLADFGLARMIDLDGKARGGASLYGGGTPGYWAPEQVDPTKGEPGKLSDIYSLGLVIGVMLTGRRAEEVLGILRGTNNTLPSTLPLEVKQVLQRATDEKPEKRYSAVKGLVTAFMRAVEEYKSRLKKELLDEGNSDDTQIAPSTGKGMKSTGSVGLSLSPTNQLSQEKTDLAGAGGIRGFKRIVARYYSIIATVVLLGFVAGILAWNLPQTHWTQLQGLDLTGYCHSLRYREIIGDSACSSPIDMTTACDWQWSRTDLHIHSDNPSDPNSGYCYDAHQNQIGGINDMDGYCRHLGYYGMPVSSPDKTGDGWSCQQKLNVTLACMWEFSRSDVQARRDDADNWDCYTLF